MEGQRGFAFGARRFWAGKGERSWRTRPAAGQKGAEMSGAPGRIRTCDHLLRRQMLCPAELRAPLGRHRAGSQGGLGSPPSVLGAALAVPTGAGLSVASLARRR